MLLEVIGNVLLVMGYSCSDFFDINPILEGIDTEKNTIYYLQHEPIEMHPLKILPINSLTGSNPFKMYPGCSVNVNTDFFIQGIGNNLYGNTVVIYLIKKFCWKIMINSWKNKVEMKLADWWL